MIAPLRSALLHSCPTRDSATDGLQGEQRLLAGKIRGHIVAIQGTEQVERLFCFIRRHAVIEYRRGN